MIFHTPLATTLLLSLLSGAAGLAHQILWTRRLVDALGANAGTFAKVIGAFFAGLALGAWIASRARRRSRNPWRGVAHAELAVALLAVPMLFAERCAGWPGAAYWLAPAFILPPALAMGLVLPRMVAALRGGPDWNPRHGVLLYAVNTLGGVVGVLAVTIALPALGLMKCSVAAIAVNTLVAGAAILMAAKYRASTSATAADTAEPSARENKLPMLLGIAAFASGALVLALEVLVQHQLAQVSINSFFSGAVVLVMALLALAAGAVLAPLLRRVCGSAVVALGVALLLAATALAVQPFTLTLLRNGLNILPYELPPLAYLREMAWLGLVAICPAFCAAGLVFPLVLGEGAGRNAHLGLLLALNGLGGWLGSEAAQMWLAPQFGLWRSVVVLAAVYGMLAAVFLLVVVKPARVREWILRTAALGVAALLVLVSGKFSGRLRSITFVPGERLVEQQLGREGLVATVQAGPGDWRMLFNNSYTLGGSRAQFNQERQALLPVLLHGRARSVALLGVATGSTTAGGALAPGVEQIEAIELSPLVLAQARRHFTPFNRNVFADPRVTATVEDARLMMARRADAHDVIVGDLFLPWRTGEGRLYTREHFENIRRALRDDGLFCQWLPMFQLTRPQFETILRAFRDVFPNAFLVRGDFYAELPILGLVGGRDFTRLDWSAIESRCAALRAAGVARDPLVRHADGVAMLLLGPAPAPPPGPVNTLHNGWLEWNAGRNITGLRTPWFIGVPCAEFTRDAFRAGQPLLPENRRAAHDAGQFFLTLEVAVRALASSADNLASQSNNRLPPALRTDTDADWRQWPMRFKARPQLPPPAVRSL